MEITKLERLTARITKLEGYKFALGQTERGELVLMSAVYNNTPLGAVPGDTVSFIPKAPTNLRNKRIKYFGANPVLVKKLDVVPPSAEEGPGTPYGQNSHRARYPTHEPHFKHRFMINQAR